MYYVIGNSQDEIGQSVGLWYANQVKRNLYAPYAAIGFLDDKGIIKGAAILDGYNGSNINIHVFGPRCVTKKNLKIVLNYIFNELKCTRATSITKRSNKEWLKVLPRLNFKFEAVLISYFGSEKKNDGVVYRMTPIEASKWIKING